MGEGIITKHIIKGNSMKYIYSFTWLVVIPETLAVVICSPNLNIKASGSSIEIYLGYLAIRHNTTKYLKFAEDLIRLNISRLLKRYNLDSVHMNTRMS